MYRIGYLTHTIVVPVFHLSSIKFVRDLFHTFLESLDNTNRAIADGKALDQLRVRLVCPFRVTDVVASESVHHSEVLGVNVFVPVEITAEEELRINTEVIKVNLRCGSKLRVHIIAENRK